MTEIQVFADVSCPFAHVGLHRWFDRRRDSGRSDVGLRVRSWPLELVNGAPLTGEAIAGKVAALSRGFPELFAGFDPSTFPTSTLAALELTNAAYDVGVTTGELVATELRDLLFVHGRDISSVDVLAMVATDHSIALPAAGEHPSVLRDLEEGRERGVIGSPHYFGSGFDAFCPGLDIDHVGAELDVTAAGRSFDDFADRCFEDGEV